MASAAAIYYSQHGFQHRLLISLLVDNPAPAHTPSPGFPKSNMFQTVQFPKDALPDIVALVTLSHDQLKLAADWADSIDAIEPVDAAKTVGALTKTLQVDELVANRIIRIGVVLKKQEFAPQLAENVVEDLAEALRLHAADEDDVCETGLAATAIIEQINEKSETLGRFACVSDQHVRHRRIQELAAGTQPTIAGIRTFVQLRPLFDKEEDAEPDNIECMVPAMTLQLKIMEAERERSATFSLDEEKLDDLIKALQRAKAKFNLMKSNYGELVCKEIGQ